jgi:hypothetical protein
VPAGASAEGVLRAHQEAPESEPFLAAGMNRQSARLHPVRIGEAPAPSPVLA